MSQSFFNRPAPKGLENVYRAGKNLFGNLLEGVGTTSEAQTTPQQSMVPQAPQATPASGGADPTSGGGADMTSSSRSGVRSIDTRDDVVGSVMGHEFGVKDVVGGVFGMMPTPNPVVGLAVTGVTNFSDIMGKLGFHRGVIGKGAIAPQVGTQTFRDVVEMGRMNADLDKGEAAATETNEQASNSVARSAADVEAGVKGADVDVAAAQMDAQAAQNDVADLSGMVAERGKTTADVFGEQATDSVNEADTATQDEGDDTSSTSSASTNDGGGASSPSGTPGGGRDGGGRDGGGRSDSGDGMGGYGGPDGVGRGNDRGGGIGFLEGGVVSDQDPSTNRTEEKFARISEGEFVLSRAAVQYYGLKKLEDMNIKAIEHFGTPDPKPGVTVEEIEKSVKKGIDSSLKENTPKSTSK